MYLIDHLHQNGIGVLLDWVPSHFPSDEHGLGFFDGTHLYEHGDPRQGFHPDWGSLHLQLRPPRSAQLPAVERALLARRLPRRRTARRRRRVDALPRLLAQGRRVDPERPRRPREPRRDRLPAPLQRRGLPPRIRTSRPIAEESTSWPMVSRPTYVGGLGFGMKWDMGWMHDALVYASHDPVHRSFHHNELTFRMLYAFTENFVLPLSHDEVVHGKGSLLGKMPGDDWQKFANLRALYGSMWTQPGKKLLFMGGEFAQRARVEPRRQPRVEPARHANRTAACSAGCATSTRSTAPSRRCTNSTATPPASPGSTATTAAQSTLVYLRRGRLDARRDRRRVQLDAGAASRLPARRPARRLLARSC